MYKIKHTLLHGLLFASVMISPVVGVSYSSGSGLPVPSVPGTKPQTTVIEPKISGSTGISTSGVAFGYYYGRPYFYRPYYYYYPYRPYFYRYAYYPYRPYYQHYFHHFRW